MISKAKRHISRSIPHCQLTVESWLFQICHRYKRTGNFWESIRNANFSIKMQVIDSTIFTVIPSTSWYLGIALLIDTAPAPPPDSARAWPSICSQMTSMASPHTILPYVNRGPVTPFRTFVMNFKCCAHHLHCIFLPSLYTNLHFLPSPIFLSFFFFNLDPTQTCLML